MVRNDRSPRRALGFMALVSCAFATTGCGVGFIGTTATSFLHRIRDSEDPNVRYAAYTKLADPNCYTDDAQKDEAAVVLAEALHGKEQSIALRAAICRTLGELGRPSAREALVKAARDGEPLIRAEACRALGRVGGDEDATVLALVMTTDQSRDCRVAAIEALGAMKPDDARIDLKLVEGMQNPDPAIRTACYGALQGITGQDLGLDYQPWQKLADSRLLAEARAANRESPTDLAAPTSVDPALRTVGGQSEAESPAVPR